MAAAAEGMASALRDAVCQVICDLRAATYERATFRLDWLLDILARYSNLFGTDVVDLIRIHFLLRETRDFLCQCSDDSAPSSERVFSGQRGRRRFNISEEQVQFLIDRRFTVRDMPSLLGVSVRTVERRMQEYGLNIRASYSALSDEELDTIVQRIITRFPNTGYRRMSGFISAQGLRVQQSRIRSSMRRVLPEGCLLRALEMNTLQRRQYRVYGPLALWHIDGNHKLIKWIIVIHGGIDGYSRMIVYLQASTNNRASTVFQLFHKAVQMFGLPSRVRLDKGGETVDVALFMLSLPLRGPERGNHIAGRSVHNQRIERLWRDVFQGCTYTFYHLFYHMESVGILDPTNEIHLFALHFVYLPRINKNLGIFQDGHNTGPLSSEHNASPEQLWVRGTLQIANSNRRTAIKFTNEFDLTTYGVDADGPISSQEWHGILTEHENNIVEVPSTNCPLTARDMEELKRVHDPLQESEYHGVDVYLALVQYLEGMVVASL